MSRVVPLLLLSIAVLACQDQGPTVPPDGPQFLRVGTRPVYRVSGGGSVVRADPSGTRRSVYAFDASLDATGKVSGQAEVHFTSTLAHLHIDVRCLVVRGNEAWLSGPVTRSDNLDFPLGAVFLWRVQDNGEGRGAAPDRISSFVWNPEANYSPAVCLWQPEALVTDPWTDGTVQINADTEGFGLADMHGTWDGSLMKYIWLEDPRDTFDVLAKGGQFRMTVAADGRFSMVWWVPGKIIENVAGTMEVVNGEARITMDEEGGSVQVVARLFRCGSAVWIESNQRGHDFDNEGEEEWSHLIAMARPKTSGTLIDDLVGTWDATVRRYISEPTREDTVNLLVPGVTTSVTFSPDGGYSSVAPEGTQTGQLILEGSELLIRSRDGSASQAFTFVLAANTLSLEGAASYDFDGDGVKEPAIFQVVVVRR